MRGTSSTGRRLIRDLPTRAPHWALAGSFVGACLPATATVMPPAGWAIDALLALAAGTAVRGRLTYNEVGGDAFEDVHETLASARLVMIVVRHSTTRVRLASLRPPVRAGCLARR